MQLGRLVNVDPVDFAKPAVPHGHLDDRCGHAVDAVEADSRTVTGDCVERQACGEEPGVPPGGRDVVAVDPAMGDDPLAVGESAVDLAVGQPVLTGL